MAILVLDDGHNSPPNADTGCSGFGLREEDITLDICKRAKILAELNGITTILTREGSCVPGGQSSLVASLNARCNIANSANADLLISVHCDAFNSQAYGTTTHIYGMGGNAERLAKIIQPQMAQLFYNRGIKVSNFQMLRDTNMPAVLMETAFLDQKDDNAKLADPNVRQRIAEIIAKSACQYFGITYKEQSQQPSPTQPIKTQEVNKKMKNGVLIYTKDDAVTGFRVAEKFGNCAVFVRRDDKSASPEVMNCETLYILGGSSVGHPNEVICSGDTWWDTVVNTKQRLGF